MTQCPAGNRNPFSGTSMTVSKRLAAKYDERETFCFNQRCNVKKFLTYKDIPLSFLYWRNWFLVLLFYILVIWIFSITTLPLLFDMPARVHSTNVSLSMRNVKLYWINIDSFCAKHLKLVMFWTLVCTRTAEVCHTMLQILVNVKSMK